MTKSGQSEALKIQSLQEFCKKKIRVMEGSLQSASAISMRNIFGTYRGVLQFEIFL